ncbi:MAG: transporter substrate-binding domain-containing protein [Erysipelotrichaceae bacterium]|nr:transporter substrate-binding domain-containing protein [Erysipelotrichaceae bacterium]
MKKIICLLALALSLSMVGCAAKEEPAPEATPEATEETVEETVEETTEEAAWVYEGIGYDAMWNDLGKVETPELTEMLANADGKLKAILDAGVIIVATSPDYPPSEFVDAVTGEIKGSDMLLGKYIANSLGVEMKIEAMDFNAVLTSIDTDKCDLAISGFGYKEDRAENYELSHGYQSGSAAAHHTLVVLAEDVDKYNSLEDFNVEGMKINAQANSLQQMYVQDQLPNAEFEPVTSIDQEVLQLQSGKVGAVAMDSTTAKNYSETSNGMFVSLYEAKGIEFDLSQYADVSGNVCAVKKGETSLMDAINVVIDEMIKSGYYTDMYYAACDAAGVTPGEDE